MAMMMPSKWYLVFPLTSAVLYALGAIFVKDAERRGASGVRLTIISNIVVALGFAAIYPWGRFPVGPALWWPVVALAGAFALGQVMTIVAFTRGEVSVATPIMGTKVLFVILLASVFTQTQIRPATWVAAVAMLAGLWLLVGRPAATDARRVLTGVICSLIAAFAYAVFDILVQAWAATLNFNIMLPIAIALGAGMSLPLLLLPGERGRAVPRNAWSPLMIGAVLLMAQSMLLIWSIAEFRDAPGANVVYASRGVWSVLLVQLLGLRLTPAEHFATPGIFARRLVGSSVMMLGVFLAFM